MSTDSLNERRMLRLIGVVSVLVPLIVALLLFLPREKVSLLGEFSFLPLLNAVLNSGVALLLLLALAAVRSGRIALHRTLMLSALVLSVIFLVSYILYHSGPGHVKYNGVGGMRMLYLGILMSHILLSAAVVPLALLSVFRGLSSKLGTIEEASRRHRRIAKITWPVWLYVAVTGVVVYLMAHPFNPAAS